MNPDARQKQMLPMWEAECCYRDLFLAQPQVYFYNQNGQFFEDWDSFSYLYRQFSTKDIQLPADAPMLPKGKDMNETHSHRFLPYEAQHLLCA